MICEECFCALLLSGKFMLGFVPYWAGWYWRWTRPDYHRVLGRLPSTRNECSE